MGRPRASGAAASREAAREDVLAAAAELFTGAGFAATTTREIAQRAGLKQASLYYHFPTKEAILTELLTETVRPSLRLGESVLGRDEPCAAKLWALAYSDIRMLGGARHNVGALYLLPEVSGPGFERFQAERAALKATYRRLGRDVLAESPAKAGAGLDVLTDLVFSVVEGVIIARRETPAPDVDDYARGGADAVLRILGVTPDGQTVKRAHTLLAAVS